MPQVLGGNKKQYYKLLAKAKIVFSANQQETFGIGAVEGLFFGTIPLVPNRLSYVELYDPLFRYKNLKDAKEKLKYFLSNYNTKKVQKIITNNKNKIRKQSLESIDKMAEVIKDESDAIQSR